MAVGLGAGINTAHAKSLGGVTSKTLLGKTYLTDPITDKFDEANNTVLNGTSDTDGAVWSVQPGAFKITSSGVPIAGYVVPTTTSPSEALVPGTVNAAVGIDLHLSTSSTGCGVILNAAGGGSYAATFLYYDRSAQQLTLERVLASGATSWSMGPYSSKTVITYLFLTYVNGVYTAYQDGVQRFTITLNTAQKSEAEAYTKMGFGSVSGTSCQFDNFQGYGR